MSALIRVTQPASEPITLAEAKAHLRIDTNDDDTLVGSLISAARDAAERYCGRSFASADFIAMVDRFPLSGPMLFFPDISACASIEYLDSAGNVQTFTGFTLDEDTSELFPATTWPTGTRLKISFTAGADPEPSVKAAMLMLLTDYYENRGAQQWQQVYTNMATEALLHSYRWNLGV